MGNIYMFEKGSFASTVLIILSVLAIMYWVVSVLSSTVEVYYYYVDDLTESSKILSMEKDRTYTNYTRAKLYNSNKVHVGEMSSVNFHQIMDGKNRVSTLTTYSTNRGTVAANIFYETEPDTHYLYGTVDDIVPEHETGEYKGRNVSMHLIGKRDGERQLTITTTKRWF